MPLVTAFHTKKTPVSAGDCFHSWPRPSENTFTKMARENSQKKHQMWGLVGADGFFEWPSLVLLVEKQAICLVMGGHIIKC